jgi:hypothetical protein
MSLIMQTGVFDDAVKVKFDLGNDELAKFTELKKSIAMRLDEIKIS